ncbi:MAG: hypothetical protein A3F72_03000 [Bacteroidetes bacterium RIFCSPLOWO2_12_FULL_35_15]|nr:MAG: hypothetical protein A3F72_03000 [Bacteroidetes bacterium RIFCSPLOWO2_12_FULL_35_15]
MVIAYEDLGTPDGQEDNMGGTKQKIFFAPIRDFLAIQVPNPAAVTPGAKVEIATAHTFVVGKCWNQLYCTLDKGSVEFNVQGERDGHSFGQLAKIFHPGAKKEAIGFASLVKNDQMLVLVPLADGTMIQIGSADFYAQFKPKFNSGTNSGGVRGHEFEISSMAPVNYVYTSTVSLVPAV